MAYAASSFSISIQVTSSSSSEMNIIKASFSNPNLSVLRHKVTWSVGDYSYQSPYTNVGAKSASYTIPDEWYSEAPDSETMTVRVSVETYSGSTKQGSTAAKTCTINVPFQFRPTAPSVNAAIMHERTGFEGKYIQGITGVTVTLTGVQASDGTSIDAYHLELRKGTTSLYPSVTIASITQQSNIFVFDIINDSEFIYFYNYYAIDSRGRQGFYGSTAIYSSPYTAPTISAMAGYRCLSDGTPNEYGTYATIKCVANHTPEIMTLSSPIPNPLTINCFYYPVLNPSQRTTAQLNMVSNTEYIVCGGNLDPDTTYVFEFVATDAVGEYTTGTITVDTVPYSIHVKNGGHGVAFGKASEITDAVEISDNWDFYYKGKKIDIIEVTTPGFTSLPVTFNAPGITADHELLQDGFAYVVPRSSVGSDWGITTGSGTITINGTFNGNNSTYVKAVFCDKQKEIATRGSN